VVILRDDDVAAECFRGERRPALLHRKTFVSWSSVEKGNGNLPMAKGRAGVLEAKIIQRKREGSVNL